MAKVSVKLGLTLPGPQEYSSFRADFAIGEIDTEGDVEAQIKEALQAGEDAAIAAEAGLASTASNVSGLTLEGVGVGEQFNKFREKFSPAWKELKAEVAELAAKVNGDTAEEKPAKKKSKK